MDLVKRFWPEVLAVAGVALMLWGLTGVVLSEPRRYFSAGLYGRFPREARIQVSTGGAMLAAGLLARRRLGG